MLSPQALFRGIVQRALGTINADSQSNDVPMRLDPYGAPYTQPLIRKAHNLADEGSYYTVNNAQTGIASAYNTAFTATAPFLLIYNGNTNNQRVYLDYLALVAIAAGACTTTAGYIAGAVVTDTGNRYSSGGTNLTSLIVNPNFSAANATPSGISVYAGAITATAASASARTIVGVRNLRPNVSTTVINVVGDMNLINFGSVEGATGSITIANANIMPQAFPPVVVPPQSSALFYLTYPVMSAPSAATFAPELGFWVR
jgi:hypothetical protein